MFFYQCFVQHHDDVQSKKHSEARPSLSAKHLTKKLNGINKMSKQVLSKWIKRNLVERSDESLKDYLLLNKSRLKVSLYAFSRIFKIYYSRLKNLAIPKGYARYWPYGLLKFYEEHYGVAAKLCYSVALFFPLWRQLFSCLQWVFKGYYI